MKAFVHEIQTFYNLCERSQETKERHKRIVSDLCQYLANLLQTGLNEVHLMHIYSLRDMNGQVIKTLPLDYRVLNSYFVSKKGYSYSQLFTVRNSISVFFKYLELSYNFPNPVKLMDFDINELKPPKRPLSILTRRDVLKFFHCLVSTSNQYIRDLTMFCLIFATGCRISEILSLRKLQINFTLEFITLEKTKAGKRRKVPLRLGMGRALEWYCNQLSISSNDYLFKNSKGSPIQYETVRELFKDYLNKAGLPDNHLHITRHTFATHLFEGGSEIPIIRQLLGHVYDHTTIGYIHPYYIRNYNLKNTNNKKLYESIKKSGIL